MRRPRRMIVPERRKEMKFVIMKERSVCEALAFLVF